jgi:hypothetical protein
VTHTPFNDPDSDENLPTAYCCKLNDENWEEQEQEQEQEE